MAEEKTNVMRILDKEKISYIAHQYPHGKEAVDGVTVAKLLNQNPAQVFKTLVTKGTGRDYFVFVIPVEKELNLKKAAKAVGEKSVEMIPVKVIKDVTGYIRGGCTPIGMKKQFPTFIQKEALDYEQIYISGGKLGTTLKLSPKDVEKVTRAQFVDFIK